MINTRSEGIVNNVNEYTFHILGCGAIGSSAAIQLVRMGATDLVLYDMDIVELPNVGVSQYSLSDVTKPKVEALKGILSGLQNELNISTYHKSFNEWYPQEKNDVAILGFDNMDIRLQAIEVLLAHKPKPLFIIDGRMGAEHYQQYTIVKPTLERYKKTWYTDSQGSSEPCNAKATSYCSNMTGAFISNTVRKLITKQPYNKAISFHFPTLNLESSRMCS
jgi:molybdopterin/thiamine biosynthesis adenylyltransferase